jgi:hypothetical protein
MIEKLFLAALAAAPVGCTDDGPGGPGRAVEIAFDERGYFEERMTYLGGARAAIVGIAVAVDGVANSSPPLVGPSGQPASVPYDDDIEPYPYSHKASPRGSGPDGPDPRWWNEWVRLDGGEFTSWRVEYDRTAVGNHVARGALGSPGGYPVATTWHWCPVGLAARGAGALDAAGCQDWFSAVARGAVSCVVFDEDDQPRELPAGECARFHPRRHWSVWVRDCPPAPNSCAAGLVEVSDGD